MNLITDVFFLDNLKVIEESKKSGTMTIEGTFQRAESPNNNKRVYPKSVLTNQVGRLQELVDARRLCGELDHPTNETVKLSNASHLITKLWMEGNEVYGRAELLNTPAGKVAQTLVNDGVSVGISSRGLGTLSESANEGGYKTVNDDYKLVTFDLVADPSTKGAYPKLSEATEYINKTSRNALREKTYVTLLKQELGQRFGDNDMNEDSRKGYSMKHKTGKKAGKKRNPEGYQVADSRTYSDEEVLQVLENNIRRFISENDDPQLAAQFVRDHKEELMEGFLKRMAAGALKKIPGMGVEKQVRGRRQADRQRARRDMPTKAQRGGASTAPDTSLKGKQKSAPEGGDPNLGAAVERGVQNRRADRGARKAEAEKRKDADADLTLDVAKKKTIGVAKSAGKLGMAKLKGAWKGAAAKVHGGVAGAQERVAGALHKGVSKVTGTTQADSTSTAGGSRQRQTAASDAAAAAKKSQGSLKGHLRKNLRGGAMKDPIKAGGGKNQPNLNTDAGGPGPTGSAEGGSKKKNKQGELAFDGKDHHDWNVEFDYQMMRLHENIQRFNG